VNEEALAHWGLSRQKQTLYFCLIIITAESLSGVLVCARNLISIALHTFGYQAYAG
jgi:hypothetical protein